MSGPFRTPHVMNWDLVIPKPAVCPCPGCVRKPGHPGWHTTSPAAAAQEDAKLLPDAALTARRIQDGIKDAFAKAQADEFARLGLDGLGRRR